MRSNDNQVGATLFSAVKDGGGRRAGFDDRFNRPARKICLQACRGLFQLPASIGGLLVDQDITGDCLHSRDLDAANQRGHPGLGHHDHLDLRRRWQSRPLQVVKRGLRTVRSVISNDQSHLSLLLSHAAGST